MGNLQIIRENNLHYPLSLYIYYFVTFLCFCIMQDRGLEPSLYCNGKGIWTVPSGTCLCSPGYQNDLRLTRCEGIKNLETTAFRSIANHVR